MFKTFLDKKTKPINEFNFGVNYGSFKTMLTDKEVKHIADLARIKINKKEQEALKKELSLILDYINKLQEVDTANTEPTAQATGLTNVFRKDDRPQTINPGLIDKLISQAPQRQNNYFKVKAILKEVKK